MAESRYNRLDNQSPTQTQLQNEDMKIPRSAFDFSTIHSGNAFIGAVIPVDCFDVVLGENVSISMANLLEFRNPTTRQLLNGFRVYFHGYYNKLTDLWEGAKNFLDTGLSGSVSLSRPNLIFHIESATDISSVTRSINACTPLSLLNFLHLPAEYQSVISGTTSETLAPLKQFLPAITTGESSSQAHLAMSDQLSAPVDYFPADCAFAYQRNWRDYYSNRNLLQSNKLWFPDNENHFILSYSCENAVCVNYENEDFSDMTSAQVSYYGNKKVAQLVNLYGGFPKNGTSGIDEFNTVTPEPFNPSSIADTNTVTAPIVRSPNLSGLKFRQFRGDRFTTALPFPDLIRGDIPVISLNKDSVANVVHGSGDSQKPVYGIPSTALDPPVYNTPAVGLLWSQSDFTQPHYNVDNLLKVNIPVSKITQNALRALETFTVFKERNARISSRDSFYNGFIEAQFGSNPHTHDSRGTYLGGFYQDFAMSSVTQTSQSADTPLGTKAGQGVSNGQGTICNDFYCSDFGWIQVYMSIVPDVFYTQGKPRMYSKKTQLDMYFPLFNNLEPQAILNKELFVSGNSSVDDDVFAYEDRYAEYKSRPNYVSGFMALSHSAAEFDSSRIMARRFTSTPALNHQFVMMVPENIDMEVFSVYDEPPFDFQCGISVRRVSPMPYTAVPGSMSSQIHA